MSEAIPRPLTQAEIIDLLSKGACIQRDRHGAAVIQIHGRCGEDWEELRLPGWLNKTTSGTYVLSERGIRALARGQIGGDL